MIKEANKEVKLKSFSLLLFVAFLLVVCVGGVLANGVDCSAEPDGTPCGECIRWGCHIDPFWETLDYWVSGTKTCQGGECSSSTCIYEHVCADLDLFDGFPDVPGVGSVVACNAECDGDEDCESYCKEGTWYYDGDCTGCEGEPPICKCDYETQDCDSLDGYYCNGNVKEYRDYYCSMESGGCYCADPVSTEDCTLLDDSYCSGDQIMLEEGYCYEPSPGLATCEIDTVEGDDCYFYNKYCSENDVRYEEGFCNENGEAYCDSNDGFIEDCDDKDDSYCGGDWIINEDWSCSGGECVENGEDVNCYNLIYYCEGTQIWEELWSCHLDEFDEPYCGHEDSFEEECDNGDWCDGAETCSAGNCVGGNPPNCDDGVSCTDDSCNEETDSCDHAPNDGLCDNGQFCDGSEWCDITLGCQDGSDPDCSDENECTQDICNEDENECQNPPEGYGTLCGSFRDCPIDGCDGVFGEFFPDDGHDFCDGFGVCVTYSCEMEDSYCCDGDSQDGINGLDCGAECDQNEDCNDVCGSNLLYINGICDLVDKCSCSYTKIPCNEQCAVQACGGDDYVCYDEIWTSQSQIPPEDECNDGVDNDCDGLIDCEDPDCEDLTFPKTLKYYGQPRYPIEIKTDELCYKDEQNDWQCYEELASALENIGYTELPAGDLIYKERGPVLEIIVNISGLKSKTDYQLTLNGRNGNYGNYELGGNCDNPNGPKEGYDYAWECGTWVGGTGEEGFWNFDMTATTDENGNYEETYFLMMPPGHYGIGPGVPYGFGFIVKEAADVPGGSNYPPVLMEVNGLDWYIDDYTYPLWINSSTPIYLEAEDPEGEGECVSGIDETYYRISLVDDIYCLDKMLCYSEAQGSEEFLIYEGEVINIDESSCHLIEYHSIDNKGNPEKDGIKKQCIFVENDGPIPNKTVEEVKTKWLPNLYDDDYETSYFYPEETAYCWVDGTGAPLNEEECKADPMCIECWKVTLETPINMECELSKTHPVPIERLCFKLDWDGEDVTNKFDKEQQQRTYCDEYEGYMDNGYCCRDYPEPGMGDIHEFYFMEESEHNLEYFCEDVLGNKQYDDEKFKVFGWIEEVELKKKWNLISVPFDPLNKDPEEVFKQVKEDIDSVWSYDAAGDGEWHVYRPSAEGMGTNDLEEIETGLGYWVMASDGATLTIGGNLMAPGPVSPPSQKVVKGWNLIGHYGTQVQEARCSLLSLVDTQEGYPRWSSLWEYDSLGQEFFGVSNEGAISPWKGYWLEMDVEDYYAPTTCEPYELYV